MVYKAGMSVMKAIGSAGGFSPYARRGRTQVLREGKTIKLDLSNVSSHPANDIPLQPEDQIIVPE